jgi:hypothetical protein
MNQRRWRAVLGLAGIAVAVPSCGGGSKQQSSAPQGIEAATKDDLKALRDSLAFLLDTKTADPKKNLNKWLQDLANSVCQIEMKAPASWGLDPNVQYCTKQGAGPPDKTPPPAFPPK